MRLECIESEDSVNDDNIEGALKLFDDNGMQIGLLDYYIRDGYPFLHVTNLVNLSKGTHKGVGTLLMNEAVKISLKQELGFEFEIAKGSELFYRSWIPNTFNSSGSKSMGLFSRIQQAKADDGLVKRLSSQSFSYSFEQLKYFCKIRPESDFDDGFETSTALR